MDITREFYESILDAVDDGLWVSDRNDRIVFCNSAMHQIAGVDLNTIIGLSVIEDFPEETTGQLLPHYIHARESLHPIHYEVEVVTPAGRHCIQAGSLSPQVIDGQFAGMICTIQDVTETRRTERELIEAGSRSQRLLDIAPSIIIALDREGFITLLNQEGGRILGCEPKEALGRNWFDTFIPQSIRDEIAGVFAQLMDGQTTDVEDYENEIVTSDGTRSRLIQWHNSLLRDAQGSVTGLLSSGQDITERRETERQLQKSHTIINSTTDVVITTSLEGTVTYANAALAELYGYEPEELMGQPVSVLWREEDMPDLQNLIDTIVRGEAIRNLETSCVDRQGNEIPALISLVGVRDTNGTIVEILGVTRGIRALEAAQEALRESETRLTAVLDNSPFPVAVVDEKDQNILYWSKSARDLFGHNPHTTFEWYKLAYPDSDYRRQVIDRWEPLLERAHQSEVAVYTGEYEISCSDGSIKTCELYAQFIPGNLVVTMNDVTDRRRTALALRDSEKKYRTLVDNAQQGVIIAQANPVRLCFANPAMSDITGYAEDELLAMKEQQLPILIHADDRQHFFDSFRKRIAGKDVPHRGEYRIVRKDGMIRWVSLHSSLIDYLGEKATLTTFVDVTEKKNMDDALREVDLRMKNAVEAGRVGLWDWNLVTNETYYSPEWKAQIGYEDDEITDAFEEWQTRVHPDDLDVTMAAIQDAIARVSQEPVVTEFRFRHKNGSYRWILTNAAILTDDQGKAVRMLGSHIDITDRKATEEALRRSKQRLEEAQAVARVGSWDYDIARDKPTWSKQMFEIFGLDAADSEPTWEEYRRLIHPDDWGHVDTAIASVVTKGQNYRMEFRIPQPDGSVRWAQTLGKSVRDDRGKIVRLTGTVQDITRQKEAEIQLREVERRNRALLDYSPVCHKIVDLDLNLQYMSRNGFRMLKLDEGAEVYGRPYPFDFFPKAFREEMTDKLEEVKATGEVLTLEALASDADGNNLWLHSTLIPVPDDKGDLDYITVVSANITAERLLETRLRQSQKLESIGTLAGGVAHEINNPLQGILNYAELLKDRTQDAKSLKYLTEIDIEGRRIAGIVRNLLSFSRQDKDEHSPASIADIINRSISLVGSSLRKDQISIELDIAKDLPQMKCRSQQIQQVLINLLTNAHDALEKRYTGYDDNKLVRITVRVFEKEGGNWIRTTVEDHGIGISEDLAQRIFDPFFTTKSRDRGTGLGLSVSFGIVREHHGEISVESTVGEFTRFHVDLPARSE